jgi:hypothetical protein
VALAHRFDQADDPVGVADVDPDRRGPIPEPPGGCLDGVGHVGADDAGTLPGEPGGDGGPQARTRPGHDGDALLEPAHGLPTPVPGSTLPGEAMQLSIHRGGGGDRRERKEQSMGAHEDTVRILEAELGSVEQAFRGLSAEHWRTPTRLLPVDEAQPPWTLFELAGHFDISIGLTVMLMAEPQAGQVGRDRVSFFIFPRSEVAPVVYAYAYTMVEGKTPEQLPDVLGATFAKTVDGARAMAPDTVGPGYYALMRLDEFVASRVVEAVVHGLDLTDALGREPMCTPAGVAATAAILDELLARKTVPGRPADLAGDDLAWVRAASGRGPAHPDPRLPLIG